MIRGLSGNNIDVPRQPLGRGPHCPEVCSSDKSLLKSSFQIFLKYFHSSIESQLDFIRFHPDFIPISSIRLRSWPLRPMEQSTTSLFSLASSKPTVSMASCES